ncbi:ImmA/IrrE family metallo-endopeptidase [Tautonia plasticadhaerens]|uniref:IrrE N-terminal-like domain-containing protein n=1 Tax=Tautonia plasticadhaerens TaxID=2527974 RepID=A0A518GZM9_9BACT|nr:ImmA/IrrE family metallo-endopeptidase [Tautonia plasticadhaerens]QDV34048.1 hypothetical protein ElP_19290 [Tautonia plasticadhaerens]
MSTAIEIPYRDRQSIERIAERYAREAGLATPPFEADRLASHLGLGVTYLEFDEGDVAGQLVSRGGQVEIRVRESDPPARQNFTIAHEIGHRLLHPANEWEDTEVTMYRHDFWGVNDPEVVQAPDREELMRRRAEAQANAFATALLMPEGQVRENWNLLKSPNYLVPLFKVSRSAMLYRLKELGLIVPSVEGFQYVDLASLHESRTTPEGRRLADERGPIPAFPPIALDDQGRILPMVEDDRDARQDAFERALKAIDRQERVDPPGLMEAIERGIDERRPHRKLFGDK